MILKRDDVINSFKRDLWLRIEHAFGGQLNFAGASNKNKTIEELIAWLDENTNGPYHVWMDWTVLFVEEADAVTFHLAWGGA